jgi:hypothetical protein
MQVPGGGSETVSFTNQIQIQLDHHEPTAINPRVQTGQDRCRYLGNPLVDAD